MAGFTESEFSKIHKSNRLFHWLVHYKSGTRFS